MKPIATHCKRLTPPHYGIAEGDWLSIKHNAEARKAFNTPGRRFNISYAMAEGMLREKDGVTVLIETRPTNVTDPRYLNHPFALQDMKAVRISTGDEVIDCTGRQTLNQKDTP